MDVKISVIMGIYNCASYLQEALDSLYNQTFQDFEIIICDDGSSDNTYQIAERNAQSHSNIVLLKNEKNKGLNYTLNKCLQVARGEYIARMDGDDISLPYRFEKQYNFLENNPEFSIVSSAMKFFDENGTFGCNKPVEYPEKNDFLLGPPFCHAPCMVRREAYLSVKGYTESKRLLRVEDYHLWFKMYAKGYKGYNFLEPLYMMRDDASAISRRAFKYRLNSAFVRIWGYRQLGIKWYNYVYVLRPILIGLLPSWLYKILHKR